VSGAIVLSLIFPFTFTLLGYVKEKAEKKIIISHLAILFYLFLEFLLDYILIIPFREMLAIHVPYIIVFYVADFSMIGVSFNRNRKMGFVVTLTFWILIGCLVYLYLGWIRLNKTSSVGIMMPVPTQPYFVRTKKLVGLKFNPKATP
jgi:hypothetical protein